MRELAYLHKFEILTMPENVDFKCLRCGHEFTGPYDKKMPIERSCPQCKSNSVRKIKKTIKK